MRILHGHLQYSPEKPALIQLLDTVQQREFDIWPYVDETFPSLSGLPVVFIKDDTSFLLSLGGADWVFQYGKSREDMLLKKHGTNETLDIAKILNIFLTRLNGRQVVVEADNEHFKITATQE